MSFEIKYCGDSAVTIVLGNSISPSINARVAALYKRISDSGINGISELVPAYCSITVHYNPLVINYNNLHTLLKSLIQISETAEPELLSNSVIVPVCYGGEFGPDLPFVAKHCGLSESEVIMLHAEPEYLVYMLGFMPGFPYLGGMNKRLETPRLKNPRTKIPAGSVGIAGMQTGIYPMSSPGGWQIIGRTPIRLFDVEHEPLTLFSPGMQIKFETITPETFLELVHNHDRTD